MRLDLPGLGRQTVTNYTPSQSGSSLAVIVPLLGILLSETFVFSGRLDTALWGHLLTLLFCITAPLVLEEDTEVLQAFALVPLFRLVNLGVPVAVELTLFWLPLVYAPLLPALYLISRRQAPIRLSLRSLMQLILIAPLALVLSFILASVEYRIIEPASLIPSWNLLNVVILSFVMIGLVALVEEWLFRVILQQSLVERLGTVYGILIAALVFGFMHSAFGLATEIGFAFAFGLVLGIIYKRTDNLLIVILIHGALNVFLFGLFPTQGLVTGL